MRYKYLIALLTSVSFLGCSQGPDQGEESPDMNAGEPAVEMSAAGIEMRPRPSDPADFPEYIDYLVEVSYPRSEEERAADAPIQAKFEGHHNIDSIVIAAPGFPADITLEQYEEYMDHFIENNFTSMSVTITNGSDKSVEEVFERAEYFNEYLVNQPERYMQIKSYDDFETALAAGKLGVFYNFQSMNAFGEDISNVEKHSTWVFVQPISLITRTMHTAAAQYRMMMDPMTA